MKNFKSKIAVVLSVGMLFGSITPVLANDTYNILLDGRPLTVTIDLSNVTNNELTIEELLSIALGGNVTIVESQNIPETKDNAVTESSSITSTEPTTKSKITLPNRKLTDDELKAWIEDYEEQGGANEFELEVVRLVNIERAKENLEPLEINSSLMKSARFKSQELIDLNYFAHKSPVYGEVWDFAWYIDEYCNNGVRTIGGTGENLVMGITTPEDAVECWMNSPGHRANILRKDYKTIGVGYISGKWTNQFALIN